jgi:uncharacterized membrane protein YphA (DoxX/SURF4 family)
MFLGLEGSTLLHIAVSLVAIASGFMVIGGFLTNRKLEMTTLIFLVTTVATNATGFLFPFAQFLPSHLIAIISLLVLPVAIYAYYGKNLSGPWRWIYVVSAVLSLYLNVFVLVVQTFAKNPALAAIAPTQSEPPFLLAQAFTLLAFVGLGYLSLKRYQG